MATYSTDLTTRDTADAATNWVELTGTIGGFTLSGAGTPAADGENFIQGVDCVSQTTGKAVDAEISIVYDHGANLTFTTGHVVIAWCFYAVGTNLKTKANDGWMYAIADSLTTGDYFTFGGSDSGRNPYGGWTNVAIDPTATSTGVFGAGANGGNYRYFGPVCNTINEISKGTPSAVDAIRTGRGEISVTGTGGSFAELASYNDWNSIATPPGASSTVLDSGYHRLGLFQEQGGTFLWKGLMSMGITATSATFTDSNTTIIIDDSPFTYAAFNKIEINHASSVITWTSITFIATGTVAPGAFEMVDDATVNLTGCSFNTMGTFIFDSNATLDGCVFNTCALITSGGGSYDGCSFNSGSATSAVLAATPAEAALIQNCTFDSDGTGNGLEITGTAANMTLTGCDFIGYDTADPGTAANKAIYVNIATGTMTITISGGSGVTQDYHVRSAGATVTVSADTTVTFDKMKDDSEVRIYAHTAVANTDISFTSTTTIASAGSEFGVFAIDDEIKVTGSVSNDGTYRVLTASAASLTVAPLAITTESAGASVTIKKTNQVEIDGIEDATAGTVNDRSFAWAAASATVVDYVIHHWSGAAPFYKTIRVNGYVVPGTDTTIDINQLVNRNAE